MNSSEQSRGASVLRHFNRQAIGWENKLKAKGSMADRPGRFVDLLREYSPAKAKVLDFGCGTGEITAGFKTAGFDAYGIDRASAMINHAQERFATLKARFHFLPEGDRFALPYENESFDAVVASSVFEYVEDLGGTLRELMRVCRPDGVLIMSVPDMTVAWRWVEEAARPFLMLATGSRVRRLSLYCEYLRLSQNRFGAEKWRKILAASGWEPWVVKRERSPLMVMVARVAQRLHE